MNIFIKNKLNYILVFIWFITVLIAVLHHEVWFDVALSYLFVKEHTLKDILFEMGHLEVHPPLWYLAEYPFVKILGCKLAVLQVIAFAFTFLSVCFFCFKSRFNFFIKFLFIFSAGMTYLLPVIGKNYSLIPLFIFILADIYPERLQKPVLYAFVIALLSQIHAMMWGFCAICSFFFLAEIIQSQFNSYKLTHCLKISIKHIIAVVILVLDFMYLKFLFKDFITGNINDLSSAGIQVKIHDLITMIPLNIGIPNGFESYFFIAVSIILFLIIFIINKKSSVILLFSVLCLEAVSGIFLAGVPAQKMYVAVLFLIFSCWICEKKNKITDVSKDIILSVLLAVLFFNPPFYKVIKDEINNFSSNQPEMQRYLNSNLDENDKILLCVNDTNLDLFYLPYITDIKKTNIQYFKTDTVNNSYLDEYISKNHTDIKFIVIPNSIEQNLKYPYIKVFDAPKNALTTVNICNPALNEYTVYMRVK